MANVDSSGFRDFDQLTEVVRRTHGLLDLICGGRRLEADGADFLADATLPHLEAARLAFRAWLRAEMAGRSELQYLVRQDGVGRPAATSAEERRAALLEAMLEARLRGSVERAATLGQGERQAMTALAHARLVLGLLPRLPDDAVRFPAGRRTYADIPVPRGPAELAGRIEELERQVWRLAVARAAEPLDPAFRRTYGFFDVADRLSEGGFRLH